MFFEFTNKNDETKVLLNINHVVAFKEEKEGMAILLTSVEEPALEVKDNYATFMNQLKYASMQQPQPFHRG